MNGRRFALPLLIAFIAALPLLPPLLRGEVLTLRDHTDYFVPMRAFTAETIRSGELPLWNPYNGSGERWLANPQTAVFYPPAWLFLVLPLPTAYVLFLAFHLALLAVGVFRLFRIWSNEMAAAFGAIAATLCGSTMSLLDVGNNLASLAWTPWVVAEALSERREKKDDLAALLLTLCFLGGEPLIAFLAALIWCAVMVFRFRRAAVARLATTACITAGLSAVQLLPFIEYLAGSDRAAGLDPRLAFSQTASFRDWASVAVAPWAFAGGGLPSLSQSFIPSMYAGTPIVMLAVMAMLSLNRMRRGDRYAAAAAWLTATVLVSALFSTLPQWGWAREIIVQLHLNVSRYPARVIPIGLIALCGLAALGLDRLASAPATSRFAAGAILIALLAVYGAAAGAPRAPHWRPLAGFLLVGLWIGTIAFFPRAFADRRALLAASLLLVIDLSAAARPFLESGPFERRSAPYASVIPADRRFARLPPKDMQFDRESWLAGYRNLLERKFDLSSPAPAIPKRYLALHDAALYGPRFDLLRFLSVEYLITDRPLDLPPVAASGGAVLRRLPSALPFAVAWPKIGHVFSDDEAWARLMASTTNDVLITGAPEALVSSAAAAPALLSPPEFSTTSAKLRTRANGRVMLTLNQLDARGWIVTIDGARASSLHANALFRAVIVPAGEHLVEWRYRPWSLYAGAIFSLTTLAILFARIAPQIRKLRSKNSSFHRPSL